MNETPQTVAQDGKDISATTAMPAGGWGIRGWLSSIYTKMCESGGQLPVVSQPYLYSVAEGDIASHHLLRKLGRASAVSTSQIDVCGMNAVIPMIAAQMQMSLKSTSTDDDGNPAGTGVQTVDIEYLDNTYTERSETVTLNGTGWVDTTATNIFRIQSLHTHAVGALGYAAGIITIVDKATRAIVYDQIDAGYNRSFRCQWTVPTGKTAYISAWGAGAASGAAKSGEFILKTMSRDGVLLSFFMGQDILQLQDGSQNKEMSSPIVVPATASIKISVKGTGTLIASAFFAGWYE